MQVGTAVAQQSLSNSSLNPNRNQRPPSVGPSIPSATTHSRRSLPRLERDKLANKTRSILTPAAESLAAQNEEGSLTGSDDISILAPLGSNTPPSVVAANVLASPRLVCTPTMVTSANKATPRLAPRPREPGAATRSMRLWSRVSVWRCVSRNSRSDLTRYPASLRTWRQGQRAAA